MFFRLISLVLFLILSATLANWLAAQPGYLRLEWLDWRLEIRTSLGVAILVVLAGLLIFADRLWRRLTSLPGWFGQNVKQRRHAAGHKALTLGLMAVSAGEPGEAKRQATRAQRLLDAPQLTDLLSAQAANLAGDHRAAGRYFRLLTQTPDTAFLGYIGLCRLAHQDNRPDDALAAARQALVLKPKSAMAAAQVVDLEAAHQNWAAAAPALDILIAAKDLSGTPNSDRQSRTRQKVALAYLQARPFWPAPETAGTGADRPPGKAGPNTERLGKVGLKLAVRQLESALATDPGFWPAILLLADHHLQVGNRRKATKLLEAGFRAVPHVCLADRLKQAWNVNEGAYVARLIGLVPDRLEAQSQDAATIAAAAALTAGMEGEARRLLAKIPTTEKDVQAWHLEAQLAKLGEDSSGEAVALRAAGNAPRPRGWQCNNCHVMSAGWHSHCNSCDGFATLIWQRPDHLTPISVDVTVPTDSPPQAITTDN